MIKKKRQVWSQKYKRINYSNCELKLMLLKSVVSNKNIKCNYRLFAYSKLILNDKKYNYKNYKQTCTISGKSRGVWSFCNFNRHKLNELNRTGQLIGVKSMSW